MWVSGGERGKEGGRKFVMNICELVMITYAKEKNTVLESERSEFIFIS